MLYKLETEIYAFQFVQLESNYYAYDSTSLWNFSRPHKKNEKNSNYRKNEINGFYKYVIYNVHNTFILYIISL